MSRGRGFGWPGPPRDLLGCLQCSLSHIFTLENNLTVPQKGNLEFTYDPAYIPEINENIYPHKNLNMSDHSTISHNS
jgi:hypothetical protein